MSSQWSSLESAAWLSTPARELSFRAVQCTICFQAFGTDLPPFVLGCPASHTFCRTCLAQHCAVRRFPRCPGCVDGDMVYELTEAEVRDICGETSESLNGLQQDILSRAIDTLGRIVRCPNPTCTNAVAVDQETAKSSRQRIDCSCGWPAWCTVCRQPYHYHVDCEHVQPMRQRWLEWVSNGRAAYHNDEQLHQTGEKQRRALEDATARHTELQCDEDWKALNCRECPRCGRCVEKVTGCDAMVCGQDAHGGNMQSGCGAMFSWRFAPAYQAVREGRPLPTLDSKEIRLQAHNVRHVFSRCNGCKKEIVGPRFRCIHCPDYDLCVNCDRRRQDVKDVMSEQTGVSVLDCTLCEHPDEHVFEIIFKPDYDLTAFMPIGQTVLLADHTPQHGWEAIIESQICEEVYNVRLVADRSVRTVHKTGLQVKLSDITDVARHVQAHANQVDAHKRSCEKRRAEAVQAMRGDQCAIQ